MNETPRMLVTVVLHSASTPQQYENVADVSWECEGRVLLLRMPDEARTVSIPNHNVLHVSVIAQPDEQ